MNDHPKANAIAENVILRLAARVSMLLALPAIGVTLTWIYGISDAQDMARTFQATQQIEMTMVKERISSLERTARDGGVENTQILQRLTTVETLMRTLVEQSGDARRSFDELTRQLIRERRTEVPGTRAQN